MKVKAITTYEVVEWCCKELEDDVVTTGGSLIAATELAQQRLGLTVAATVAMVDRGVDKDKLVNFIPVIEVSRLLQETP